jgi:DNA-binding CsgD family transcriptional regulator
MTAMASPSLLGRKVETDIVDEVLRDGGALVVTGPAGIGKSALLLEAERSARERGMTVLAATGVQAETRLPFAGLHQLLRPILHAAERLPAPQRDALSTAFGERDTQPPSRFLVGLGTLSLLTDAAADGGLLVIAEDVQWLDVGTVAVLAFVARRLGSDPVSLLIGIREGHESPLGDSHLVELRLEGLGDAAAGELLDASGSHLSSAVRARILAEAQGNPLALIELPSALASEQVAGTESLPELLPLTTRLERAFAARMEDLSPETNTQLLVAAVNDSADVGEVLLASARIGGAIDTAPALEEAAETGLVDLDPVEVHFRHPLVRSAIAQAASDADRRAAHAALAAVLTRHPDRRAWHRAASIVEAADDVAEELEAAAVRAERRGGMGAAVAGFERAAQLSTDLHERGRRLTRAADLAFELGRRGTVTRLLGQARSLELSELTRVRMTWIEEMLAQRILGAAELASLVGVADRARELGDPDLAIDMLWMGAQRCYWSAVDPETRGRIVDAAERIGSIDDDPRLLGIVAYAAPTERGSSVVEQVSRPIDDEAGHPEVTRLLGTAAAVVGAFDLAIGPLASAAGVLRAQGRLGHLGRLLVLEGWSSVHLADWNAAATAAEEARALASEMDDQLWGAGAKVVQAIIAAARGEATVAETLAAEVEEVALPLGVSFLLAAGQIARGVSALGDGRYLEAYEHLRRLLDPSDPAHHPLISTLAIGDLIDAAVHSGHRNDASVVLEELSSLEEGCAAPRFRSGMRFGRALVADDAEAEVLFQAALDADLSRWPFDRARVLLAYGAWLRRQRRVAESRAPLRGARDAFDALGALPWGERARQELRAAGEVSRPRTPEMRDRLTPQELQIAQMAADGLSNREIGHRLYLSHRTVGSHLYRIFPKLGVAARSELRDALSSTGSVT